MGDDGERADVREVVRVAGVDRDVIGHAHRCDQGVVGVCWCRGMPCAMSFACQMLESMTASMSRRNWTGSTCGSRAQRRCNSSSGIGGGCTATRRATGAVDDDVGSLSNRVSGEVSVLCRHPGLPLVRCRWPVPLDSSLQSKCARCLDPDDETQMLGPLMPTG